MFIFDPVVALIAVALLAWVIKAYAPLPANIRPVLNVVLGLIVVGIALELINLYVPMAGIIKAILNVVVVIATCVWVFQTVGLWSRVVEMWHRITTRHQISG